MSSIRLLAITACVLLASCSSVSLSFPDIQEMAAAKEAADDKACQADGAAPGSEAYKQCRKAREAPGNCNACDRANP